MFDFLIYRPSVKHACSTCMPPVQVYQHTGTNTINCVKLSVAITKPQLFYTKTLLSKPH